MGTLCKKIVKKEKEKDKLKEKIMFSDLSLLHYLESYPKFYDKALYKINILVPEKDKLCALLTVSPKNNKIKTTVCIGDEEIRTIISDMLKLENKYLLSDSLSLELCIEEIKIPKKSWNKFDLDYLDGFELEFLQNHYNRFSNSGIIKNYTIEYCDKIKEA